MTRRQGAALAVVLGLLLLFAVRVGGGGGSSESAGPVPSESIGPGRHVTRVAVDRKACDRSLQKLRAQVEALDAGPDRELEATLALARGQATRVAGQATAMPASGPETEAALADSLVLPEGIELVGMDCSEYPCIFRFAGPPTGKVISTGPFTEVFDGLRRTGRLSFLLSSAEDVDGRLHASFAMFGPEHASDRQDLFSRVQFREGLRRASERGTEAPARLPPAQRESEPLESDACGPEHDRLREILLGQEARRSEIQQRIEYFESVVEFVEGPALPFPETVPERFRDKGVWAAGERLAERLSIDLVSVDCSEYPCMVALSARVAAETDVIQVHSRVWEAAAVQGYSRDETTVMFSLNYDSREPILDLVVALHAEDYERDDKRLEARREDFPELSQEMSPTDWSQAIVSP